MAEAIDETGQLKILLEKMRPKIIHRALVSFDRSPESFNEEIVTLNAIEEALRNL